MTGINHRYNGLLYKALQDPIARKTVMSKCIARCAKAELREIMRLRMRQVQAPSEEGEAVRTVDFVKMTPSRSFQVGRGAVLESTVRTFQELAAVLA